jgi:hypothetical protein
MIADLLPENIWQNWKENLHGMRDMMYKLECISGWDRSIYLVLKANVLQDTSFSQLSMHLPRKKKMTTKSQMSSLAS